MPPFWWIRRSSGLAEAKGGERRKGDLCQFCRKLGALALLNGKKGRILFGSLKDDSEREGCALCDIVLAMLSQLNPSQEETSAISCHLVPGFDGLRNFVQVAYEGTEREHFRVFLKKKDELSLFCARPALV